MAHIERHQLKNHFMFQMILDNFYSSWDDIFAGLHEYSSRLGTYAGEFLDSSFYSEALNKNPQEVNRLLKLALDFGIANFVSAVLPDEPFEIEYDNKKYSFERKPKTSYTDEGTWIKTFYLALITGSKTHQSILLNIPNISFKSSDIKTDYYHSKLMTFLKSFFNDQIDAEKLLKDAILAIHSPKNSIDTEEYRKYIELPILNVFEAILTNQENLDYPIEQLLIKHKEFWSNNGRSMFVQGWVSLPATALIKYAQTKHLKVTITSDYVPSSILNYQ